MAPIMDHLRLRDDRWLYYVHYAGIDRRFDEWAEQDRIGVAHTNGRGEAMGSRRPIMFHNHVSERNHP